MIAKRRASRRYQPGAGARDWLEVKARPEQEFVVCGWEPARTGAPVVGSLQLGVHDDEGVLVHVGGVGTGFTAAQRRALAEQLAPLAADEPPCQRAPRSKTARWVRPELVVRCEFAEWTGDEHVRQASFKGLAPDRDPATVRRERPLAAPGPCLANQPWRRPPSTWHRRRRSPSRPHGLRRRPSRSARWTVRRGRAGSDPRPSWPPSTPSVRAVAGSWAVAPSN